jgi:hypothetical protein
MIKILHRRVSDYPNKQVVATRAKYPICYYQQILNILVLIDQNHIKLVELFAFD